ncbi:MAG: LLM class F420-dependent oxidoreductase [Proteobacteria bacterium]|nr:LLM class F420-dependent oxidoreductase [Pseudomonadota bacterium]
MKISVVFPSVVYREGPQAVAKLMQAIEHIGFDELNVFDHVLMGYETEHRPAPFYPAQMPILEALTTLAHAAAVTERIGLGTGVLVLPQRQPTLVAKQVATLDVLSGGRIRLGVGVGWQASEYDALEQDFHDRGARMDEAIRLLRHYWSDARIDFDGEYYQANAMAMEPKSPQAGRLPIWIGGSVPRTLQRVGELGDGWMSMAIRDGATAIRCIQKIREFAEAAGRDPSTIGLQTSLSPFSRKERDAFYTDPEHLVRRMVEVRDQGFEWGSIDMVGLFQAGFRTVDALIDQLGVIYTRLAAERG